MVQCLEFHSTEAISIQAVAEVEGWRAMVKPTDADITAPLDLGGKRPTRAA